MVDQLTLYGSLAGFWVLMKIWQALGGWPEAYWRIRRKRYFVAFLVEEDGQISRNPILWKRIFHRSPSRFPLGLGEYLTGGVKETGLSRGRPSWVYEWDDCRPIPIRDRDAVKMPPSLIKAGFANDAIERTHGLRDKKRLGQMLLIMGFLITMMVAALAAYYSYNTACAVHSPVCVAVK